MTRDADTLEVVPCERSIPLDNQYSAVIRKSGEWWIGWLEDIPGVNAQAHTREELIDDLKSALSEILELNRTEARAAMEGEFEQVLIAP